RDRRSSFERYREWEVARARVLADRLAGRPCVQAAEDLEVPKDSPATLLLDVDAHLVRGDAYWAEDRIDEAAKEWRAARGLAHFALPYDTLRVGLALVALEGRRGAVDEAARIWTETVGSAAELAASRGIRDPGFWERAIDRRPSGAAWPDRIDSWLQAESDHARPGDPEIGVATRLLGWIGRIRLERDEAQLALMALTRACEATESDPYRAQLQILVARAMLAMGEPGQSRLILEQLRGNAAIELRLEARALLAALDLRLGNLERGVDELRAVLAEAPDDWPGRFETEANLGLADLASGREEDGLRRLHAAQNQWQVLRRHDALIQSLANEIRYFEGVGRMDVVRALRSRLAAVGRE
ncbi:MAG: hypothetical protein KDC38_19970, partial [Planctomycetes bacterium]|nr:hypothetical protein [Planctomycetota bacterium]